MDSRADNASGFDESVEGASLRPRSLIKAAAGALAPAGLGRAAAAGTAAEGDARARRPVADKHTLVVLDPGHFHAALTLRERHPRLSDDVHVYAEDGPDVDNFVHIVRMFNRRAERPTRWNLHVYRGGDHLQRLLIDRPGDVVIVAGKNDTKMTSIHRLHAEGFHVLGDKPWLIAGDEIDLLGETVAAPPLAMDIMTERHEIASQVQKALVAQPELFGAHRIVDGEPTIHMRGVHHLYKIVNKAPLVRPHWYFDVAVQGEGILDVTTHLVDLVQWMTGCGTAFNYERDLELLAARQWPIEVSRDMFAKITGLEDFPASLRDRVVGDVLPYLCNASFAYRLRGVPVQIESLWALAVPEGGGDAHRSVIRGTKADVVVEQGRETGFATALSVHPVQGGREVGRALESAVASLQDAFPGLGYTAAGDAYRIVIPDELRTTHEEHFAAVLDEFLESIDAERRPENLGPDLVTKYTLLVHAAELSHRGD